MEVCTIGVIASPEEESIVREFFELFKIPWEFVRSDRIYQTVICSGSSKVDGIWSRLLVEYAGCETRNDEQKSDFSYRGSRLPIYGSRVTFDVPGPGILVDEKSGKCAGYIESLAERAIAHIGYNLFAEIKSLLVAGQPAGNGGIPTLDVHIALLRDLITGCGIPLVEIPPVPDGYSFIACLTHDVDHATIRRHKFDDTMFGFLYRSTLGSAIGAGKGRMPIGKMFTNWCAAAKLPFVYLGLSRDFWYDFDRYIEIEDGKPSTFYFIPFAEDAGRTLDGKAPNARASAYGVAHVAEKVSILKNAGCEIGLHGLDAWMDSSRGREEASEIRRFSGGEEIGIRMHWLYGSQHSAALLESGGFTYDSTVGYNETVGYRAGTSQVFMPPGATRLLELPLLIMDTALFTSGRMNLSADQALLRVDSILANAVTHGGTLTVNWHDRSIAPERLWGDFYIAFIERMQRHRPWFSTAMQAVSWFRSRREAVFEHVKSEGGKFHVKIRSNGGDTQPALRLRYHKGHAGYVDTGFRGGIDIQLAS